MKRGLIAIVATMVLLPAFSLAAGTTGFPGGQKETVLTLTAPSFEASVNLTVPVRFRVVNATLNVTGLEASGDPSAYPEAVSLLLNGSVIWAFNGTGYGPLGRQNLFSDGGRTARIQFGPGGGTDDLLAKLPKNAAVQRAIVDVKGSPPRHWEELMNITGAAAEDGLYRCACAGDVNRDGYDDFIVGASGYSTSITGYAYLFYGGPKINSTPDLVFNGTGPGDGFGAALDGAGDLNGDGYDDIIIGAPLNDSAGRDAGAAFVFFGGPAMDTRPDLFLTGEPEYDEIVIGFYDQFGSAVSGAGDVNGDGYDDLIVGADQNDAKRYYSGRAYIYFGGRNMDNLSDMNITGDPTGYLGHSVSDAGDVNNDGYGDVIVGAPGTDLSFENAGQAYVYFGGKDMDNVSDVSMNGTGLWDQFGRCVSGAGDVNGDGFDDVVVGADDFDMLEAGRVEVFFGGRSMDGEPDIVVKGAERGEWLGWSVSGAGDINQDGYDDILIGAGGNDTLGENFGQAYIFYGGQVMDDRWDVAFNGTAYMEWFSDAVAGAGDVNGDGCLEVLVGASSSSRGGQYSGCAYLFCQKEVSVPGLLEPSVSVGTANVWKRSGYFKGGETTVDFAPALNSFLRSAPVSSTDAYGNAFVDVPLWLSARDEGNLSLFNLTIEYEYNASAPDFAGALNEYIAAHKAEADAGGNLSVAISARSESAGRVRLSELRIRSDLPPVLVRAVGTVEMDEDTVNDSLVDLYSIFEDDFGEALTFSVASATNSSLVPVEVRDNRYISADALTGAANDNWTGTVEVVVACTDPAGQRTESDRFTIRVRNVNDPPVVTSEPAPEAEPGIPYSYDVIALDGDRDALRYSLARAPPNMTIDLNRGTLQWLPRASGVFDVEVLVHDGLEPGRQNFSLSVPNRPPRFTSLPSLNATAGHAYTYLFAAEDSNLDNLNFSLLEGPGGMQLGPGPGRLTWKPDTAGSYKIAIEAWDGKVGTIQTFTIKVSAGTAVSNAPFLATSVLVSILVIGLVIGACTEAGKYKLTALFLPLYTRLKKDTLMDNETRGYIRGVVDSDPGIHYHEILRRLKLSNGLVTYHLKTLEREGFIKSRSEGRWRRFYPAVMKLGDLPPTLDKVQRIIVETVRENEGLAQREVARILHLPPSSVNRQITRLAEQGILRLEKRGMTIRCYMADGTTEQG